LQAFIHLFPLERARNILQKMLRTTRKRIYLSTTVHDVDKESFEAKEGTDVTRFRHRYTETTLIQLIRSALNTDASWAFHIFYKTDPLEKNWFNVVLFRAESIPPYLTDDYVNEGYLLIRRALNAVQVDELSHEADRLKTMQKLPEGCNILRYAQRDTGIFDRVENFLPFTTVERDFLSPLVFPVVRALLADPEACLFKDKLNYKPPKFGKFPAHQDAAAGWPQDSGRKYMTAAIAIDATTEQNGSLQVVKDAHHKGLLTALHTTFPHELEASLTWESIHLAPGDCLFFDSFVPHRSNDNLTDRERRLLLITFQTWRENHAEERQLFFANKRHRQPTIDDDSSIPLIKDSFGKWVRPDVAPNGAK
jgi:2-aminoethylphosphonate dioxygenase